MSVNHASSPVAIKFLHSRGRVALTRELADVQEVLADMGNLQEFNDADKQRWNELRAEEAKLWKAIQALNRN